MSSLLQICPTDLLPQPRGCLLLLCCSFFLHILYGAAAVLCTTTFSCFDLCRKPGGEIKQNLNVVVLMRHHRCVEMLLLPLLEPGPAAALHSAVFVACRSILSVVSFPFSQMLIQSIMRSLASQNYRHYRAVRTSVMFTASSLYQFTQL